MPKHQQDDSQYDSQQEQLKFVYKKPQVFRLDKFKNLKKIVINLSTTQYPVVTDVAEDLNWKVQYNKQAGDWDVYWTDIPIDTDTLIKMHLFQKINYYPGIHTLARKNLLGMNLMNMKQKFPSQYNFFPLTWMLPAQYSEFRQYYQKKAVGKTRTYIVKPQADCQGRGIFLTRNIQDLQNGKHYVVQRYVTKPYLIDNLKFDLRIYVLLCGTNPLRLYIYQDGLARFATQKYVQPTNQNLQQQYIHLTNYAINKKNPKFVFNNSSSNMGTGHKRSLKCVYQQLKKKGMNIDLLKQKINDLIIKTIICGLPLMSHQYKCCQPQDYSNSMCFHVLGFDVMIDSKQQPILIQVNHTPSFATDTPLDYSIKFNLIKDTLKLMHITSKRKNLLFNKAKQLNQMRLHTKKRLILQGKQRQMQIQLQQKMRDDFQNKHLGGYSKIYPLKEDTQQKMKNYNVLIQGAYKMHYCQNTPIRIKLQEAQMKKQIQQDMKKMKKIQNSQIIKDNLPNKNNSGNKLKNTITDNPQIQSQLKKSQQKSFQLIRSKTNQNRNNNDLDTSQIHIDLNDLNNQIENDFKLNKVVSNQFQSYVDLSVSTPIQVNSMCQGKNSLSQSTTGTKYQQKIEENPNIQKNIISRMNSKQKMQKQLNIQKTIFQSIQKQLVNKQALNQRNSGKFINSIDKKQNKLVSLSQILGQQNLSNKLFLSQNIRKNSRQRQLPNIYDHTSSDILRQGGIRNVQKQKMNSASKNPKIISPLSEDMRQIIQNKRKKLRNKNIIYEQIPKNNIHGTKLISRKINILQFKSNDNPTNTFVNNIAHSLLNKGGFLVPKMYNLNVQSQKRIQNTQNLIDKIISRKNINKIVHPF